MSSSTSIPHSYSSRAETVSPLDWNAYMTAIHTPTRVTSGTTLSDSNYVVLCDTDGGAITITLPAGADTSHGYIIKNVGSSGNNVTITPDGVETIEDGIVYDGESAQIEYNATEGWVWV